MHRWNRTSLREHRNESSLNHCVLHCTTTFYQFQLKVTLRNAAGIMEIPEFNSRQALSLVLGSVPRLGGCETPSVDT
jgi:hypothetical protein